MSSEKESFVFYRSFFEAIKTMKDKDRLKIYDAICEYALNEKEISLTGIAKGIFEMAKPIIVSSRNRYNACVENGKKGGRPKKETNGFENKKPNNNLIGFENKKTKQNLNENVNVNVNENVNVNDKVSGSCVDGSQLTNANDSCVDDLQKIIDFYNNNIGAITPYGFEILSDYAKDMSEGLIMMAMKKAVEANKRTIQYIKGILNNWERKGIKTVIEAQKEDEQFRNRVIPKEETEEEKIARKIKELEAINSD